MRYGFGYFEEEQLGQLGDLRLWHRIGTYIKPFWKGVAVAVCLSFLVVGVSLLLPYLLRLGIDNYITNGELSRALRFQGLFRLAFLFGGLMLAGFLANFCQVLLLEWTGQHIMHRLRQDLFSHLLGQDFGFFNRHPVGKLVTRLTNDVQNMHEMFTSVVVTLFNDLLRIGGILLVLFWMNWRLALLVGFLLPLVGGNLLWFSRLARRVFRELRTQLARINSYLQESLTGLAVIQLFLREKDIERRFAELNQGYFDRALEQIRIFGLFMPLIETMSAFATGLIIWYGGGQILKGNLTLGMLVAFLSYMRLLFQPLRELSQKYSLVQSAMASAERLFQLLDTRSGLALPAVPARPAQVRGELEFRQVTFGYEPGQPVIRGLDLTVAPGETLAVVGATGAGKTTLINLLERFYDPDAGTILLDGVDLRQLELQWLRQQVGLVMQDVFLFPGSIRENILLDQEMDDAGLTRIIEQAQLAELVGQLPRGWETRIGEGGTQLSAGQGQLLAFARVLARNPRLLILDEATASVDTETEIRIERAIAAAMADRTSIVIAHRLSTIRDADRIIVMSHGHIVEQGTHLGLMEQRGLYHHLQEQGGRQLVEESN